MHPRNGRDIISSEDDNKENRERDSKPAMLFTQAIQTRAMETLSSKLGEMQQPKIKNWTR